MATAPFPGIWTSETELTGNSEFVVGSNGTLWLVGNSSTAGVSVFRSVNSGVSFTPVAVVPGLIGSSVPFDPAVCLDNAGVMHFVGQAGAPGAQWVQKYSYDTVAGILTGPTTITPVTGIGADYDIAPLAAGHTVFVGSTFDQVTETVFAVELDANGFIVEPYVLVQQALSAGNRLGSVSLLTPDEINIEVYLGEHQKLVSYGNFLATITVRNFSSGVGFGSPTQLNQFTSRHVDNRLTVSPRGAERFLSQCFYQQERLVLAANVLLGYLASAGAEWQFVTLPGTAQMSITQPTFSLTSTSAVVAYTVTDLSVTPVTDGVIHVAQFDPASMGIQPDPEFRLTATATILRGTQMLLPAGMPWGFLAQAYSEGTARFYTGFDAPPVAVVTPTSLVGHRGLIYTFDASASYSPGLDPLEFAWYLDDPTHEAVLTPSTSGTTCTVYLPFSIGPAAQALSVELYVTAFDSSGDPVSPVAEVLIPITLNAVAPPIIAPADPIQAERNSDVTIVPTVTYDTDVVLTAEWEQTSGTEVELLSAATDLTLVFNTSGASVNGETLIWTLTVSDGINLPVSGSFSVIVPAVGAIGNGSQKITVLYRSLWGGDISSRNDTDTWDAATVSTVQTTFFAAKRVMTEAGYNTLVLTSTGEVTVWGMSLDGATMTARVLYLPDESQTILDAVHTETDTTLVLGSGGWLYRFTTAPQINTDSPEASLELSTVDTQVYSHLSAGVNFANVRVLALWGVDGCLLLEMDDTAFTVTGVLRITQASGLLYGGDIVRWVRTSNVESLSSGQVLVGCLDTAGNSYETLIDLPTRSVVGTWQAAQLRNTDVVTGEVLSTPQDSYAGAPVAPLLSSPASSGNLLILSWTQTRADLTTGYTIQVAIDGGAFEFIAAVASGAVQTISLPSPSAGHTYQYQVRANSADGSSPWSNTVTYTA